MREVFCTDKGDSFTGKPDNFEETQKFTPSLLFPGGRHFFARRGRRQGWLGAGRREPREAEEPEIGLGGAGLGRRGEAKRTALHRGGKKPVSHLGQTP